MSIIDQGCEHCMYLHGLFFKSMIYKSLVLEEKTLNKVVNLIKMSIAVDLFATLIKETFCQKIFNCKIKLPLPLMMMISNINSVEKEDFY